MRKNQGWRAVGALGVAVVALGCGGDDGGKISGQGTFDGGAHPGDSGSPNLDGASGQQTNPFDGGAAQDGGPLITNAFAIRGRLASAPGDTRTKAVGDAAVEHRATHVMAVNPAASNPTRYLAPLADDGSFVIGVDLNTPWIIVLVDSSQVGSDMVAGVFRASDFDLDSVAATKPGMLDLGDIDVDPASGTAHASVATVDLLRELGLSQTSAELLGAMDDISLRYVNPDVDGNGKIDVQEGISFGLDFHLRYSMTDGTQPIPYTALLHDFADPATTRATYGLGSAIAYWPNGRFAMTTAADYRIRFASSSGTYSAPPMMGAYTAGAWIEEDSAFYTSAGTNSLGISFDDTQPFPIGTYEFEVLHTDLTFTDVQTHTLAELNQEDNLVIPFLKLNTPDATCEGWSCPITGFDYRWMRRDGATWVPATAEEVALIVPQRGGFLGFTPNGDPGKRIELTIPGNPVTGTLPFATPTNLQGGVTAAEIAALTVDKLCHVGISYDDTLGMRIFQGWQEAPRCNGL